MELSGACSSAEMSLCSTDEWLPSEAAIEIGELVEAAGDGDLADLEAVMVWVREHFPGPLQPKLEHRGGAASLG